MSKQRLTKQNRWWPLGTAQPEQRLAEPKWFWPCSACGMSCLRIAKHKARLSCPEGPPPNAMHMTEPSCMTHVTLLVILDSAGVDGESCSDTTISGGGGYIKDHPSLEGPRPKWECHCVGLPQLSCQQCYLLSYAIVDYNL